MPPRSRCVPFVATVLIAAVGLSAAPADDKDPVKEKLFAAKKQYDKDTVQFRKAAGEWLDRREGDARRDGDKKAVDQVKAEREAFDEGGKLSKGAPAALQQQQAAAKKALDAAYADAVRSYTRARKDDLAAAVEAEWKGLGARAGAVDLLALVDPKAHAVAGQWKRDGGAVVGTSEEKQARLQLPYEPGEEYDVEVRCRSVKGNDCVGVGIVAGGRQVLAAIDGWPGQGTLSGLDRVDNKHAGENATTVKGAFLKAEQDNVIACSVRAGKLDVLVNGKSAVSFKGDFGRLSLAGHYAMPNKKTVFLFVGKGCSVRFSRVVVTPVKGNGKILK